MAYRSESASSCHRRRNGGDHGQSGYRWRDPHLLLFHVPLRRGLRDGSAAEASRPVRHDFPVNILCRGNLEAGTALIDRHPGTRFIIDHLGIMQPRTSPASPQAWADLPKVLDLAKRPKVVIKVSGACAKACRWMPETKK